MIIDFDNFRNLFLILYVIHLALLLEISIVFLGYKARKPESQISYYVGISFALMTLGCIFHLTFIYYYDIPILDKIYQFFLVGTIMPPLWSVHVKKSSIVIGKKVVLIICFILIILFGIAEVGSILYTITFYIAGGLYFVPIGVIIYIFLTNFGYIKRKMVLAFFGYLLVLAGNFASQRVVLDYYIATYTTVNTFPIYVMMLILMNIGAVLLYFGFNTDIYLEINWKDSLIEHIVIYSPTNVKVYDRKFKIDVANIEKAGKEKESSIPKTIDHFNTYTKSLTEDNRNINIIQQGSMSYLIEKGEFLTSVFVIAKNLNILRFLIKETNSEFEKYYSHILNCDIDEIDCQFDSMTPIADRIFKKYEI